ncbi:MAG: glycogen-binding domain-containing protein [Spirochaetota bacterium]
MKNLKYTAALLLLLLTFTLPAAETSNIDLHVLIMGMQAAVPPFIFENNVIITYKAKHPVRFAGAAFAHENFRILHDFVKNGYGVFILIYPIPDKTETLRYRLAVDGLWMEDPVNPLAITDATGIIISQISIPKEISERRERISPKILGNGYVRFLFKAEEGKTIFLTGDFNNWDPFLYQLEEQQPGLYSLTLKMPPGKHAYHFIYNGKTFLDPLNPSLGVNPAGDAASTFVLP